MNEGDDTYLLQVFTDGFVLPKLHLIWVSFLMKIHVTPYPLYVGFLQYITANKLRGKVESSEYKHVVLGLIFLKFASDKFEDRKRELIGEGKEKYVDMVEFYTMKNVFYLPEEKRQTK